MIGTRWDMGECNAAVLPAHVTSQWMVSTIQERQMIWHGILEWEEEAKTHFGTQKRTRQLPCQVLPNTKVGEPELKTGSWPQKLVMQLMPEKLIGSVDGAYLKNSKSVVFHPSPCEALDSLTDIMSDGYIGCVHFNSAPSLPICETKVLILLYTIEKRAYLGFIPNDQTGFVDHLQEVIQHENGNSVLVRQEQVGDGVLDNNIGALSTVGISHQQVCDDGSSYMDHQRSHLDDLEIDRQRNLMRIDQLKQTLEAAQQQEPQYRAVLVANLQQTIEMAQLQEIQYEQEIEAHRAQRGLIQMGNGWSTNKYTENDVTSNNK